MYICTLKQIYKRANIINMSDKKNIRGEIAALDLNQEVVFDRDSHKTSTIRNAASIINADTRKRFTVNFNGETITVKRIA